MDVRGYQSWWVWGVRACIAVLFGLLELFYPAPTLSLAVLLYGAFTKLDSLLSIMIAAHWLRTPAAPPLMVAGGIGVVAGIFALVGPTTDQAMVSATLGMAAIVRGGLEAVHAARIRERLHDSHPAIAAALLIGIYGVVILLGPHIGLTAVVMAFAVYATTAGICYFFTAMRLRNIERAMLPPGSQAEVS